MNLTDDEIINGLKYQHVIACERIKKMVHGELKNTPLHILTFDRYVLPNSVKIGFLSVDVKHYIPAPMQCKSCHRFGHTKKRCEKLPSCSVCSKPSHNNNCDEVKCINCHGLHQSTNKKCPELLKRKEILELQKINRWSYLKSLEHYKSTTGQGTINSPIVSLNEALGINLNDISKATTEHDHTTLINNNEAIHAANNAIRLTNVQRSHSISSISTSPLPTPQSSNFNIVKSNNNTNTIQNNHDQYNPEHTIIKSTLQHSEKIQPHSNSITSFNTLKDPSQLFNDSDMDYDELTTHH